MTQMRQRYVSEELTHCVGRADGSDLDKQYDKLVTILKEGLLTPRPDDPSKATGVKLTLFDQAGWRRFSSNDLFNSDAVCFCDIPVDDLWLHVGKYGRFGLSFTKKFLVAKGATPVFYVAANSALPQEPPRSRRQHFDEAIEELHRFVYRMWEHGKKTPEDSKLNDADIDLLNRTNHFLVVHILSFVKFFDETKRDDDPGNLYMEREWRVLGNISFSLADVRRVILPKGYAERFRQDLPEYSGEVTFVDEPSGENA